jgi:hypothetical protein
MTKYYSYRNCEIKHNSQNDEYSAFDEDGEEGIYLGGGCGAIGKKIAEKAIDDYLDWKNSYVDAVNDVLHTC